MNHARAKLALSATSRNRTSAAPTAASVTMNAIAHAAVRRAGWPGAQARQTQTSSAATASTARPLLTRCENSTSISRLGARGMSSPLQRGQCAPHPAPDRVART